jgi:hypothetical protein
MKCAEHSTDFDAYAFRALPIDRVVVKRDGLDVAELVEHRRCPECNTRVSAAAPTDVLEELRSPLMRYYRDVAGFAKERRADRRHIAALRRRAAEHVGDHGGLRDNALALFGLDPEAA